MAVREIPESAEAAISPLPDQPRTAEEAIAASEKEYGVYVAARDIYVGNGLAYVAGDPIPVSNVEAHGYAVNGLAVKRDTKAGAEVLARRAGGTPV